MSSFLEPDRIPWKSTTTSLDLCLGDISRAESNAGLTGGMGLGALYNSKCYKEDVRRARMLGATEQQIRWRRAGEGVEMEVAEMKICAECDHYCGGKFWNDCSAPMFTTRTLIRGLRGHVSCSKHNKNGDCPEWIPRRWYRWLIPRKGA